MSKQKAIAVNAFTLTTCSTSTVLYRAYLKCCRYAASRHILVRIRRHVNDDSSINWDSIDLENIELKLSLSSFEQPTGATDQTSAGAGALLLKVLTECLGLQREKLGKSNREEQP